MHDDEAHEAQRRLARRASMARTSALYLMLWATAMVVAMRPEWLGGFIVEHRFATVLGLGVVGVILLARRAPDIRDAARDALDPDRRLDDGKD